MYQQVKGVGEYFQGGTSGLGAYFQPQYERPIAGLGSTSRGCGCSGTRGVGDDAAVPASIGMSSSTKGALMIAGAGAILIALCVVPNIWDG